MTVPYPKRLIEVDLPIKRISAHARREKSIRHGHISTLHIWWARRPLAACRAVMCASLWPDPADPLCPETFRNAAKAKMSAWVSDHMNLASQESWSHMVAIQKEPARLNDPTKLQKLLLDFIADFASWENSTNEHYLEVARALTKIAHEALGGIPNTQPLVVDPFAGGGAIPLEALRIGAEAFASDINDVPVLINKLMLEHLPREANEDFVSEFKLLAEEVNRRVAKKQERYYENCNQEKIFAYFWARSVLCEGPGCGKRIPLIGNPHLSKRKGEKHSIVFEGFLPSGDPIIKLVASSDIRVRSNTKGGAAICECGYTTPVKSVRSQLSKCNGGANESILLAVGFLDKKGKKQYRIASDIDRRSYQEALKDFSFRQDDYIPGSKLTLFPDEKLWGKSQMNVGLYGIKTWRDVFSARQLLELTAYQEEVVKIIEEKKLSPTMSILLAIVIDKLVDYSTSLCRWVPSGEFAAATIGGEKKLPMMWDYVEIVPHNQGPGSWKSMTDWVARVVCHIADSKISSGIVKQADAKSPWLPSDSIDALITDPPYYDAIWYGDLSDLFAVWLRRTSEMLGLGKGLTVEIQKEEEIIRSDYSEKDGLTKKDYTFYEKGMQRSFETYRDIVKPSGIGVVVFAHKSTSGWEALLLGLINSGWVITSSWPIDTEREARMTSLGQAALASSIHLVCRPRENPDGTLRHDEIGDWRDVLKELPQRIHCWMPRLAEEGVVGADAIFACLGPALEIFSRYSRVEKTDGTPVLLHHYLEHVWAAVAKEALNMVFQGADASGFEEDARLTAMWLWTLDAGTNVSREDDGKELRSTGYSMDFDAARKIAQGLGVHMEDLQHLVQVKGDQARLLSVSERTKYLFGKDEASASSKRGHKKAQEAYLFEEMKELEPESSWDITGAIRAGETVLDRIHQSMILFAANRGESLKRFLIENGVGRAPQFWRLAQALSALYPAQADEKRWIDGVLARKKSLGF